MIINTLQLIVSATGAVLLAWELARYATETRPIPWHVKPFTCRPCLTFWLVLGLVALVLHGTGVAWFAAPISAFSTYFILSRKSRIINED